MDRHNLTWYLAIRDYMRTVNTVPIPVAAVLFGAGLPGSVGIARHKKAA
jgi:hypothetical protein